MTFEQIYCEQHSWGRNIGAFSSNQHVTAFRGLEENLTRVPLSCAVPARETEVARKARDAEVKAQRRKNHCSSDDVWSVWSAAKSGEVDRSVGIAGTINPSSYSRCTWVLWEPLCVSLPRSVFCGFIIRPREREVRKQ